MSFGQITLANGELRIPELPPEPKDATTIQETWLYLNEECRKRLPDANCQGLLGTQPIYFAPENQLMPSWGWAVAGIVGGLMFSRYLFETKRGF